MKRIIFFLIFSGLFFHSCGDNMPANSSSAAMNSASQQGRRAEVLFLGHDSEHHDSGKYAPWLATSLFSSGINLTYTEDPDDLNPETLSKYDGLIIYANHDTISSSQEKALQEFVESGHGLIPIHSASGNFKNSDWYIKAIGGQFKSHGTGTFTAEIVNKEHPVMQGLSEFETWDETYVHQKVNPDMTVLMERVSETPGEGSAREPYTWVRNQGKGRVFYTAYGHNDSTWTNPGFLNLVKNGVLWAIGDDVRAQLAALDIPDVGIYDTAIFDFTKRYFVPEMQEALTPEQSLKLIQVPVDFEVQLFAAEPDIINPIAMSWDERGRLWVVESVDYPNTFVETDGEANDRIKICEDTDGDGKADQFTVFADSLNIPTSLVFANGGVIVSMAPHFVFMKDTNGDDKADVREHIITGWGKNDTHAGPSNLQYGFDNKIWGVLGYSGFDGTVGGQYMTFPQGIYRFTPDGKDLEYLASSSNNTWGLGFSEENHIFISTANNTHSAYYSMPARYMQRTLPGPTAATTAQSSNETPSVQSIQKIDGHYEAHAMTPNLRQVDVMGGFTAAAGHHLYTARSFPKEYWNRIAFVCEPTVRLVHNAIIEPDGAGFTEKDDWNLMASSDEWFGPVHAQVGPDGAVWVADWYNFIIQHNVFVPAQAPSRMVLPFTEQPHGQGNAFISPLRDTNHGRIYRVVYKNAEPYTPLTLSEDDMQGLLSALTHDNMFWRMTAQRLLVESKNQAALPGLYKMIENQQVDEIGLNSPAVHALWTLHGLGALDGSNTAALQVAVKALSHPAAGVRKAAVEVLPRNQQTLDALQKSGIIHDANLNVRMTALLAMAALPPSEEIGRLVYEASLDPENAKDAWITRALLAAAVTHQAGFLAAAEKNPASVRTQQTGLHERIVKAVSREIYELPRRGTTQFPIDVSGKEIIMNASIAKRKDDMQGVIMAQGGKKNGYGMYIQDGKLHMIVNQDGKTYTAIATQPLPEKFDVAGKLTSEGTMSIEINGKQVATAKAASLFKEPLTSVVRVSYDFDNEDKVGDYEGTFRLTAHVQEATLELKEPLKTSATSTADAGKAVSAKNRQTAKKAAKTVTINMSVVPDILQFDKELITVEAGQKVVIELDNPDGMQHNLVIIKPGTLQKVGEAADVLARDPKGAEKNYVPQIPEVLYATKLLYPQESTTLEFTAPEQPGDYPFVCTFPGHWRGMNGIMKVVDNNDLSGK